jgi:hypothetical protein
LKFSHRQNPRRRRILHVCLPKSWISCVKPWILMRTACWHLGPLAAFQRHPLTRRYSRERKNIQTQRQYKHLFREKTWASKRGRPCTCSFSSLLSSTSLLSIFIYSLSLFRSFSLSSGVVSRYYFFTRRIFLSLSFSYLVGPSNEPKMEPFATHSNIITRAAAFKKASQLYIYYSES